MVSRFSEIRRKEVVGLSDGTKYGYVNDLSIDTENSKTVSLIVYGKPRFFGLFGREDDFVIRWEDIEKIGGDIILVRCEHIGRRRRKGFFSEFFANP